MNVVHRITSKHGWRQYTKGVYNRLDDMHSALAASELLLVTS